MAEVSYRTDQIGSLVRPPALLDARDAFKAGRITRADLQQAEDEAVLETLALQREAGVEVFGDGEFRRDGYQTGISEAVDGFAAEYPVQKHVKPDGAVEDVVHHSKAIVGRLRPRRRMAQVDAAFLRKHSPGPFKITLISPPMVARRSFQKGITDKAYKDRDEVLADLVNIVSAEMVALADDGVPYIQLDMGFAQYAVDEAHAKWKAEGVDIDRQLEQEIDAENACYDAARRPGLVYGMHVCRGNRTAYNPARGSYEWLAERLFDKLHVDRFLLEYDSDRAGGFEPLRYLPKGKIVVLGLVSTKKPKMESGDMLMRRIDEAAKFCDLSQIALSPQCGFHGAADRDARHLTADLQKRKLALIAETARRVWG